MISRRLFWQAFMVVNGLIILAFWFNGSGKFIGDSLSITIVALGRLAGLSAVYAVLLQFMFMGRMPWLERAFGLDRLAKIHQLNGKIALPLLLIHPILITIGYAMIAKVGVLTQFNHFVFRYEDIPLALIALIAFVVVVCMSLYIVFSRLKYESWYFVHLLTYFAVFGALGHQLELGEDLRGSNLFYTYWILLYVAVFSSHAVFRFIRPVFLMNRHKFKVARIERETSSAVSLYISGNNLDKFAVHPGQFMIFRFLVKGFWWQAHPFSLSMLPNGKELRITVKESGDFTQKVKDIPLGTKIIIDGPYGIFTDLFSVSSEVLLIAGGIGITPIRSLMEEMLAKGKNIVLLYSSRKRGDVVFKDELDELAEQYPARIIYVMSNDDQFEGERGRLDRDKLERLVPDIKQREVYLCGPESMIDMVRPDLMGLGVPALRIHYEKFYL